MGAYKHVNLELIDEPSRPLRRQIDEAELMNLADNIRSVGLLQPIGVLARGGRYEVVFGHRRLLACRLAGLSFVSVALLTEDVVAGGAAMLTENLQRSDLTPVEEAQALGEWVDRKGLSIAEICRSITRSPSWVRGRLEMLRWPGFVLDLVHRHELSAAVAGELVRIDDDGTIRMYIRCAVESGCTAAQARTWRQEWEIRTVGSAAVGPMLPVASSAGPVGVPRVSCQVCDGIMPSIEVKLVVCCATCHAALGEGKREAQASAVVAEDSG